MNVISTPQAPSPSGHYSQALAYNGLVYVSGQLPIEPGSNRHVNGTVEEQADRALRNVMAVLKAAGSSMDRVLRCTVYVADIALWPRVNTVYAKHFGEHRPARTVVPTMPLHHGFLVEVEAVAATAVPPGKAGLA